MALWREVHGVMEGGVMKERDLMEDEWLGCLGGTVEAFFVGWWWLFGRGKGLW